jgi:hypothetical protein
MAQKFMATSEAYVASVSLPSFVGLWWLARLLNGLMVSAPHAQSGTLREPLLVHLLKQGTIAALIPF